MTETIRKKMWVYGPNWTHKAVFVDEAPAYYEKGWRNHPSKVGKPLEVASPPANELVEPGAMIIEEKEAPKPRRKK